MGIFANTALRESYGYAPDVLGNVQLRHFDESESIMESTLVSVMESNEEWNSIINEMAAKEYAVLESTGQEMVYEAVDIKGFFNKVIEWFKKLWSKIAGLFQKFLNLISSKISSDAKFIKNNEDKIKSGYNLLPSEGISFKGYDFKNITKIHYSSIVMAAAAVKISDVKNLSQLPSQSSVSKDDITKYKKSLEDFKNNRTKIEDAIRSGVINDPNGSIAAGDFSKKVKEYLQGTQFTQYKGSEMPLNDIITEIKLGKFSKEQCKIDYNQLKNSINQTIAQINNDAKRTAAETSDDVKSLRLAAANAVTSLYRSVGNMYQTANGIQLSCMNMRHSQARGLAYKLMEVARKEVAESAYDSESFEALMDL